MLEKQIAQASDFRRRVYNAKEKNNEVPDIEKVSATEIEAWVTASENLIVAMFDEQSKEVGRFNHLWKVRRGELLDLAVERDDPQWDFTYWIDYFELAIGLLQEFDAKYQATSSDQPQVPTEVGDGSVVQGSGVGHTTTFIHGAVTAAKGPIFLISILGAVAGITFAAFGVWLVLGGGAAGASTFELFGQSIETSNVGVACIFIGAVTVILTLRRVSKSLDIAIRK